MVPLPGVDVQPSGRLTISELSHQQRKPLLNLFYHKCVKRSSSEFTMRSSPLDAEALLLVVQQTVETVKVCNRMAMQQLGVGNEDQVSTL